MDETINAMHNDMVAPFLSWMRHTPAEREVELDKARGMCKSIEMNWSNHLANCAVATVEVDAPVKMDANITLPAGRHELLIEDNAATGTCGIVSVVDDKEMDLESYRELADREIFVLLTSTGTTFGRVIRAATGSEYSHASIALDPELKQLYSYNLNVNGFSSESVDEYVNCKYAIYRVRVTEEQYEGISRYISDLRDDPKSTTYSFAGVVNAFFKKNLLDNEDGRSAICSEFVYNSLKAVNVELFKHGRKAIQPGELALSRKTKLIKKGVFPPKF